MEQQCVNVCMQIMKKMRDEAAAKSPGNAGAAAAPGPAGNHSLTSPALNTEMNNVVRRQTSAGNDEPRTSDTAAAAAAALHGCVSDRTSDPSASEASVSPLLTAVPPSPIDIICRVHSFPVNF